MACSALFVLDLKGRVLLSRDYRGDVSPKQAERFITKLNELEESGKVTPVILDEGVSYIYVQYSNLYLLAVAKNNINAGAILLFLHKLKEIFMHYFQELEEESLRDNFVIAYELLDEVCHIHQHTSDMLLASISGVTCSVKTTFLSACHCNCICLSSDLAQRQDITSLSINAKPALCNQEIG